MVGYDPNQFRYFQGNDRYHRGSGRQQQQSRRRHNKSWNKRKSSSFRGKTLQVSIQRGSSKREVKVVSRAKPSWVASSPNLSGPESVAANVEDDSIFASVVNRPNVLTNLFLANMGQDEAIKLYCSKQLDFQAFEQELRERSNNARAELRNGVNISVMVGTKSLSLSQNEDGSEYILVPSNVLNKPYHFVVSNKTRFNLSAKVYIDGYEVASNAPVPGNQTR